MKREPIPMKHALNFSSLCFAPEADLIAGLARRGWTVAISFDRVTGFTVGYSHPERCIAGSAVNPSFAEAVVNAYADITEMVEGD